MRLIDADAFKEYLRKGAETNADIIPQRLVDAVLDIMDGIMLDIDEQPTVDAVPVVRCMDCKRRKNARKNGRLYWGGYEYYCGIARYGVTDDGFCYYGERKDDDGQR